MYIKILKKLEKEQLLQRLFYTSRISVRDSEKKYFIKKIVNYIDWSNQINQIDLEDVQPMFNVIEWLGHTNSNIREDKVTVKDNSNELIDNAPDKEDMFIAVPKVIE